MKNFNELFETAEKVADKRSKVLNALINETKLDILPKFCESCEAFGFGIVYFRTNNKVNTYCDKRFTYDGDEYYYIA